MGNDLVKEKLYRQICKNHKDSVLAILMRYPHLINQQLNQDELCTPLILSIKKNNIDMISLLLQQGADPNIPNTRGFTPLMMCAVKDNNIAYSLMFSEHTPDISKRSVRGLRALDYAILYGNYQFARKLYDMSIAQLEKPEFYRQIQLEYNISYVNYGVFLLHLEKGLGIDALPDVLEPVIGPKIRDPVIDPRQTWKDFFKRIGNFENPPMIDRSDLPENLRPENRSVISRLRTRIELGKSELPERQYRSALNLETVTGTQAQIHGRQNFARQVVQT